MTDVPTQTDVATLPVERVRADFPILDQLVYEQQPLVYLDNAATSQKPQAVVQALVDYYSTSNANVHRALHYLGEKATADYEAVRGKLARFIGVKDEQAVVFTRGTTESINLVAYAWARPRLQPGDVVWATGMEHHSNLVPWQEVCRATGATLELIPVTETGELDAAFWQSRLDARVKLVAVTHMSNVLGTLNPVEQLTAAAHAVGAKVLVDAAQSVPHMAIDCEAVGADFMVFSAHKMCGPTGVGVLAAKRAVLEEMTPFLYGGEMIQRVHDDHSTWADLPYKFEAGTPNIAGVIGFGAALDYLAALGMDAIHAHEQALTAYAMEQLRGLAGLRIHGQAAQRGGAISFSVDGVHPHDLSQYVDQRGVAIRAGHLCAQPLMRRLGVPAVSRSSVYLYNTRADVDRLVEAVAQAQRFFGDG
jgi:cysteine desulfurase / selenocysteine lyase